MKKIILSLIVIVTLLSTLPVNADNYKVKELIPVDVQTSIHTNNFIYKGMYYNAKKEDGDPNKRNTIIFREIQNVSDEVKPLSISIALFNADRLNIGTIHICEGNLEVKQGIAYEIPVTKEFLGSEYKPSDVKYISVLSDNPTCRNRTGKDEYIGQKINEIGMKKNNQLNTQEKTTIKVYLIIGGVLLALFLYAFMFTNQYKNMDGEDVRQGYAFKNEEMKEEREKELRRNPPKPPEKKQIKTDEVLEQEQQEANKDKTDTDLHNMFK